MKLIWVWIAGALALLVGVQWLWPEEQPEIPDFTKSVSSGTAAGEFGSIDDFPEAVLYASINRRPLFIEGRRPPDPDMPEQQAEPDKPVRKTPPPRLQLTGIVTIGSTTFAMVKGGKSPRKGKQATSQRLMVGGVAAEGWKVKEILPDRVVLASGAEQHELVLRAYKPVPLPKADAAQKGAKGTGKKPVGNKPQTPVNPKTKARARRQPAQK